MSDTSSDDVYEAPLRAAQATFESMSGPGILVAPHPRVIAAAVDAARTPLLAKIEEYELVIYQYPPYATGYEHGRDRMRADIADLLAEVEQLHAEQRAVWPIFEAALAYATAEQDDLDTGGPWAELERAVLAFVTANPYYPETWGTL